MIKVFLLTYILLSINVYGADKTKCTELFSRAISNFYLENSCKFDNHLSSIIRQKFKNQGCEEIFSDADMKKLNSEILGSSYHAMKKIGRDGFCREHKDSYEKAYQQNKN